MGSKMLRNIAEAEGPSTKFVVFDVDKSAVEKVTTSSQVTAAESVHEVAAKCNIVLSMLPNDGIVMKTSVDLLEHCNPATEFTHISCSTVSPTTSRALAAMYAAHPSGTRKSFVTSPVFARPDGIARKEAIWIVAGDDAGKSIAKQLLSSGGKIEDFGPDPGASNIVKLCGNFLIASSIESIGEAMVLAEKNNVDPKAVMGLLSSTIFDCLIYKGYGNRVSHRDHRPGGFSLELGLKDVTLVNQAARAAGAPMPHLSVLMDRYTSAKAKGRGQFDWSAIGLNIAEDAGIDVTADVARNQKDIEDGRTY